MMVHYVVNGGSKWMVHYVANGGSKWMVHYVVNITLHNPFHFDSNLCVTVPRPFCEFVKKQCTVSVVSAGLLGATKEAFYH